MTFSLVEVLMLLITIGTVVLIIMLARMGQKIGSAAEGIEATSHRVNALEPDVRRLINKLEAQVDDLRRVTEQTERVATNVATVTDESRRVALDLIHEVEDLQLPERYRAAVAGAKAGIAVLRAANHNGR